MNTYSHLREVSGSKRASGRVVSSFLDRSRDSRLESEVKEPSGMFSIALEDIMLELENAKMM